MPKERIETLIPGKNNALYAGSRFNDSSELASDIEIQCVAAIAVNAVPLDAIA
jgi:hypothetical protein